MENQNMPQNTMPPESKPDKSVGALVGSIIIVIILIIGGFYLWNTKVASIPEPQGMPTVSSAVPKMTAEEQALGQTDSVLSQIATVGVSDDVASIDADIKATNLDNTDSGL